MKWMGLITLIIMYWCLFTAFTTGIYSWALLSVWCIPVLSLAISYRDGMEINGLMVVLCFLMFMACRRGLLEARMWNLKLRKNYGSIYILVYLICMLFLLYCYWQAQGLGYLYDFQGIRLENRDYLRIVGGAIPLAILCFYLSEMFYNGIDRCFKKQRELVLLNCKFFLADARGSEKGIFKGCYLDGINNGVNYHFRLTKRTYQMLKKEKNLRLQIKVGLLNGLYVESNPCPENAKKTRRRDRLLLKIATVLFLLVLGVGIWLFWFYI